MTFKHRTDVTGADEARRPDQPTDTADDERAQAREDGHALLAAADAAITRALSRNSRQFLAQGRQAGGQ